MVDPSIQIINRIYNNRSATEIITLNNKIMEGEIATECTMELCISQRFYDLSILFYFLYSY